MSSPRGLEMGSPTLRALQVTWENGTCLAPLGLGGVNRMAGQCHGHTPSGEVGTPGHPRALGTLGLALAARSVHLDLGSGLESRPH